MFIALLIPGLLVGVGLYAALRGVDVYAAMCKGAKDGLGVVRDILPPLVVLLTAIAMLRASGLLDALAGCSPLSCGCWASRWSARPYCCCGPSPAAAPWPSAAS